jgi:biopolymer transport protein ExbB
VLSLTAPLLGLLGTVHGILNTFKFLNVSKFNDFSMLSKGISEALITTELGLIIAIPGYFFTVFLEKKFHRFEYEFGVLEDIIISRKENA